MKNPNFLLKGLGVVTLAVLSILLIGSCKKKSKDPIVEVDPSFGQYVSEYTSGLIPARSTIIIRFTQPAKSFTNPGDKVKENLFNIKPDIEGKAYWIDSQTIEFRPQKPMKSGQIYTVRFELVKLFEVHDKRFNRFDFSFRIIPQSLDVDFTGLMVTNAEEPNTYTLEGTIRTADIAETAELEKCFTAKFNSERLKVNVEQTELNTYAISIPAIKPTNRQGIVEVEWDASAIQGSSSGNMRFEVPEQGKFGVLSSEVIHSPQQAICVLFSNLLSKNQDFDGLVEVDGFSQLRFEIDRNLLKIYLPQETQDVGALKVYKGIKNHQGKKLEEEYSEKFIFEDIKPSLRSPGKGTILPTSQGFIFPFEAVNLKEVTVEVVKIFENNVPYYLQVNRLGGTYELTRVGYPVLKKNISLREYGVITPNKWMRFTLDMSRFFSVDPGAMYQIKITFNKRQLLNPCESSKTDESTSETALVSENDAYKEPTDYYYEDYYYDDDYDWRERDNPCNSAYYSSSRMINQIVLSSDIGILAKQGGNGKMLVVVTDLPLAKPISGATVRITDYQNQLLSEASTNSDGFAEFSLPKTPYLVTALYNNQRGYLRVDNGSSNSLSNFDVGGLEVQRGLKGMIYGERGVWRPGDTLHLTFILEDKANTLPQNHPIIFEIRDPRGLMIKKMVQTNNPMGMFYFPVPTDEQVPTGPWRATVKVGGAVFEKSLKVETIKPNRLKINFNIDNIPVSGTISAPLNVKWLHGAPAHNLKAKYEVTVRKGNATFPGFSNYIFNDPGINFEQQTYTLWEGTLDAEGNARVNGKIDKKEGLPAALDIVFKGRVFEQGGDFSSDLFQKTYHPYNRFVGVLPPKPKPGRGWLETDTDQEIHLVTINSSGKPVDCSNILVELYKATWRWWWEQPDEGEANYVSQNFDKLVIRKKISTVNGKATLPLRINYPEWGRYYLKVTDKETGVSCGTFVYFDWPYESGKSQANRPGSATVLAVALNKDACNVGDEVQLTIPGVENSRALISIENGSRVISAWWVDATKAANVVSIKTTPDMSPNVYLHVTLIQPHKEKTNDMPIRLYGITRLKATDPETVLQPVISMPDEIKTNQSVEVRVSEQNGKKMNFTLAVVDEGLLDINRFKTPDPHTVFYAQEALGVRTWDLFDNVIGAYGGKLERHIAIGGDDEYKPNDGVKNQRFRPVVRYYGPFTCEKGRSKTVTLNLGNYMGSVRVMVVAAQNGAYGKAEKTCPVRNDLMVLATLPRVIGPQEEIGLPVNVFTMSNKVKKVNVRVSTSQNISISGEAQKNISFNEPGDKMAFFNLKVGSATGPAKITVEAECNGIKAYQTIDVVIRNPISELTLNYDTIVPANGKLPFIFSTFGIAGSNSAVLEASVLPPLNLKKRLDELIRYPHGCVEQTTSAVFPQIYLEKLIELTREQKGNIAYHVDESIRKLSKFQNADGSFRYWPTYSYGDDWSTTYVGHFLLEAHSNGYNVPQAMIDSWVNYQRKTAREFVISINTWNSDLAQAYRLYTLALAQKPEVGAMNKLKERELGLAAKMRLAAAYALIGQHETAKALIQNVPLKFNPYRELSYTYGSDLRDKAMTLETMVLLNDDGNAFRLAKEVSSALSGNRWLSTQETAMALLALSKLSIQNKAESSVDLRYSIGNKSSKLSSSKPIAHEQLNIKEGSNSITYENRTAKPVFVTLALTGIPPLGEEKSFESNITMKVAYYTSSGATLNPNQLNKGTDFTCEVTITNPGVKGDLKEMALTQIFPSGWEIQNTRFEGTESQSSSNFDYQDIRDNRVITYFGLKANTSKRFTIKLTATYAGKFYMPGPYCEAMYDNSVAAAQKGGWVVIE